MRRWGLAVLIPLSCSAVAKEQLYSPPRLDNGHGPEQRPAPERCLASQTTQPPILAIRARERDRQ